MNEENALVQFMSSALQWFPIHDRAMLERSLIVIPLLPFAGFLFNGLFGNRIDKRAAGWIGVLAAFGSFVWASICVGAVNAPYITAIDSRNALHAVYGTWIPTPEFTCSFGLYLDQLSALMVLIVTGIGTLIHLYSLGYMAHDKSMARFFAYLNLFLFSMLLLVLGDNLIMTFVGWEGVGLCSYLLIGFWYEESSNAAAGMKAFVVNRIGDLGFLLGIFVLIAVFGTVNFVSKPERVNKVDSVTKLKWSDEGKLVASTESLPRHNITHKTHLTKVKDGQGQENTFIELPKNPGLLDYGEAIRLLSANQPEKIRMPIDYKDPGHSNIDLSKQMGGKVFKDWTLTAILTVACLLLFVGAIGKSAQIPLYVWLPDAMAGPTPVSALIHAATMVTSGIYMVCRLHGLYACSEEAMRVVAIVGGCTALMAALIGLTQLDIKKVLAYSTVSQLGYMFLGMGIGMFSLGIFHVMTHAFFKALLFLGAGSVIHAMSGEQDMRYMGGLRTKLPKTFWTMLIGGLALAGVPFLAGWWSKDSILAETLIKYEETHQFTYLVLYAFGCIGAFCTAFYTFRLIGLTFLGESRAKPEVQAHIHESPPSMTIPLIVLAALSVIGGWMWHENFLPPTEYSVTSPEQALGIYNVYSKLDSHAQHHAHNINLVITTILALGGVFLGLAMYGKGKRVPNPEGSKNFFYRLSLNKFYVDETYNALIVMPFVIGSEIMHWVVEMLFIDLLVTGFGYAVSFFSGMLRRIQTGLLNTYAFAILMGTLAVLLFVMRRIQ